MDHYETNARNPMLERFAQVVGLLGTIASEMREAEAEQLLTELEELAVRHDMDKVREISNARNDAKALSLTEAEGSFLE